MKQIKRILCIIIVVVMTFVQAVWAETNNTVREISAGWGFALILRTDNTVWAVGNNTNGCLGTGNPQDAKIPIKILDDVQTISAGYYNGFAIKTDGSLWGWGDNRVGQLGDGTEEDRYAPVKIMDDVVKVSTWGHTLAIKADGTLWGWGNNEYGELGTGDLQRHKVNPTEIMTGVQDASAGAFHSLVLKEDESLWAAGNNQYGEIGNGTQSSAVVSEFEEIWSNRSKTVIKSIVAGRDMSFALDTDGNLWRWGKTEGEKTIKNPEIAEQDIKAIFSSGFLKQDNSLWCYSYLLETNFAADRVTCAAGNLYYQTYWLDENGSLWELDSYQEKTRKLLDDVESAGLSDIAGLPGETQTAISSLAYAGILQGTSETEFSPDQSITRAEIAAVLLRMLSLPEGTDNGGFIDVTADQWYYAVAGASKAHGIVHGYADNTFRGDAPITKEQLISLAARTLREETSGQEELEGEIPYADEREISSWARENIIYAVQTGLIPVSAEPLNPQEEISRGEAAVILYNLYNKL